jgi:formylglycine-generating enzyme required for sulfatase activity
MLHNISKQSNLAPLSSGTRNGEYYIKRLIKGVWAMNKLAKLHNQLSRLDASIQVANKLLAPRANPYNMVFVEGGTFTMGCTAEQGDECYGDEKPAHPVTLKSFFIGKYPVTEAEWVAVMGHDPRHGRSRLPVEWVSWDEIQVFLERLNAQTGMKYRLPTEAEWEYAARGGKYSQGFKYSGSDDLDKVAWFELDLFVDPHFDVGLKQPNELGLHDMSGSVWEWCSDWYGDYSSDSQTNPKGPELGNRRVLRGGSWSNDARHCRVSNRRNDAPGNCFSYYGFRLVSPSL